jgi:hypothetical protein
MDEPSPTCIRVVLVDEYPMALICPSNFTDTEWTILEPVLPLLVHHA